MHFNDDSAIELENGENFLLITNKKLEDVHFGLIAPVKNIKDIKLVEIIEKNGDTFFQEYKEPDSKYIIKILLEEKTKKSDADYQTF